MAAASRYAMTVSLSPVFDHLREVDMIFHRTAHRGEDWDFDENRGPDVCCSLDYAVVRDNCVQISEDQFRQNLDQDRLAVAVTMGGADAGNKTLQMLRSLADVPRPLLIWALLGAVDVAFVEAVVGAGLATVFFLLTLFTTSEKDTQIRRVPIPWRAFVVLPIAAMLLLYGAADLPAFGDPSSPASTHISPIYIENSVAQTRTPNVVTAILMDYRSLDTLIETIVIFTAGIACALILRKGDS